MLCDNMHYSSYYSTRLRLTEESHFVERLRAPPRTQEELKPEQTPAQVAHQQHTQNSSINNTDVTFNQLPAVRSSEFVTSDAAYLVTHNALTPKKKTGCPNAWR